MGIKKRTLKIIAIVLAVVFCITTVCPPSYAQGLLGLPAPGTPVPLSSGFIPTILRGIRTYPNNPFEFDFIVDPGDAKLEGKAFEQETEKLIKYFLASLTVPEKDLWVNLSPYEKDRIVPESFGQTEMGRDLLAQDYILKQITASLIYPEDELGKKFWARVYEKSYAQFGTTQIPVDTFNKVWILPEKVDIYENDGRVFIVKSRLKVMLEEDYEALRRSAEPQAQQVTRAEPQGRAPKAKLASDIVREIVIPEIEKEVNEGKNFANLRQIYHSLILAVWFKNTLKNSILNQKYSDQNKITGVNVEDKDVKQKIYSQYLEAYKKGVCDFIKVEYDPYARKSIPRKYFSGGTFFGNTEKVTGKVSLSEVQKSAPSNLKTVKSGLRNSNEKPSGTRKAISTNIDAESVKMANQEIEDYFKENPERREIYERSNRKIEGLLAKRYVVPARARYWNKVIKWLGKALAPSKTQPKTSLNNKTILAMSANLSGSEGANTSLLLDLRLLAQRHENLTIVLSHLDYDQTDVVREEKIGTSRILYVPFVDQNTFYSRMSEHVDMNKIDLAVVNTPHRAEGIFTTAFAARRNIPVCFYVRFGSNFSERDNGKNMENGLRVNLSLAATMQGRAKVLALNPDIPAQFERMFDVKDVQFFRRIVNTELFDPAKVVVDIKAFRESRGIAPDDIVLLAPNSFKPNKGPQDLVAAAGQLILEQGMSNIKVVFAGTVFEQGLLEHIKKLIKETGLENHFLFLGKLGQEELRTWYAASDITILPSMSEGFPQVLAESGMMEKAAIAYRVSGSKDVIVDGKTGLLVPWNNEGSLRSKDLAGAILSLAKDKDKRITMGQAGRKRILENFGFDNIKTIEQTFGALIESRGAEQNLSAATRKSISSVMDVVIKFFVVPLSGKMSAFVSWVKDISETIQEIIPEDELKEASRELELIPEQAKEIHEKAVDAAEKTYAFTEHLQKEGKNKNAINVYLLRDAILLKIAGDKILKTESRGFYISAKSFQKAATGGDENELSLLDQPIYAVIDEARARMGIKNNQPIPEGMLGQFEDEFYNILKTILENKPLENLKTNGIQRKEKYLKNAGEFFLRYFGTLHISPSDIMEKGIRFIDTTMMGSYVLFMKALMRTQLEDLGFPREEIVEKLEGMMFYSRLSQEMSALSIEEDTMAIQRGAEYQPYFYPVVFSGEFSESSEPVMEERSELKPEFLYFLLEFNNELLKKKKISSVEKISEKPNFTMANMTAQEYGFFASLENISGQGQGEGVAYVHPLEAAINNCLCVVVPKMRRIFHFTELNYLASPERNKEKYLKALFEKFQGEQVIIADNRKTQEGITTEDLANILPHAVIAPDNPGIYRHVVLYPDGRVLIVDEKESAQEKGLTKKEVFEKSKETSDLWNKGLLGKAYSGKAVSSTIPTHKELTEQVVRGGLLLEIGKPAYLKAYDRVYGVKAIVDIKTGQVLFFNADHITAIQENFHKENNEVIGYQLQIIKDPQTESYVVVGAQVDSQMNYVYQELPSAQNILDANTLLLGAIQIPRKGLEGPEDILVRDDLFDKMVKAQGEESVRRLKPYHLSNQLHAEYFKNEDNRSKFIRSFVETQTKIKEVINSRGLQGHSFFEQKAIADPLVDEFLYYLLIGFLEQEHQQRAEDPFRKILFENVDLPPSQISPILNSLADLQLDIVTILLKEAAERKWSSSAPEEIDRVWVAELAHRFGTMRGHYQGLIQFSTQDNIDPSFRRSMQEEFRKTIVPPAEVQKNSEAANTVVIIKNSLDHRHMTFKYGSVQKGYKNYYYDYREKKVYSLNINIYENQPVENQQEIINALNEALVARKESPVLNDEGDSGIKADAPLTKGGVDFNPVNLKIESTPGSQRIKFDINQADFENMDIQGLYPVIINVTPVTNLPLLLGASSEEENLELSKL